jgi:hypothetical protein
MLKKKTISLNFIFGLFFMGNMVSAHAAQINTYAELLASIRQGNKLVIVTDFRGCKKASSTATNSAIDYFAPESFLIAPGQHHIATSHLHFTYHADKPVYEFIKYTFTPDNTTVIEVKVVHPKDFSPITATTSFFCSMRKDISVFSH